MQIPHRLRSQAPKPYLSFTLLAALLSLGCASRPVAIAPPASAQAPSADSTVTSPPAMPDDGETLPDEVMNRVLQTASQELDRPLEELGILRYSRETWPDGCLGLGGPAELCLFALVEGWQVEVVHGEDSWFYRTDLSGDQRRLSTAEHNLPPSIQAQLLEEVASTHRVDASMLAIASAEPRIWDGCLNLPPTEDTACIEIGLFGWQAVVTDGTASWVYHSDGSGSMLRLNPNPQML
jgi:hypothetical protein